jgi:hypothetical protein
MNFFALIGIVAAIIFIVGDIPYLADTLRKKTTPHRVSWGIAFMLNTIALLTQISSGAEESIWSFWAYLIMTGLIFLASLFHGVGGYSKRDFVIVLLSMVGVALWQIYDDPWFGIAMTAFVFTISITPTFIKAREDPESETRIAWLLATISAALTMISVGEFNPQLQLLPLLGVVLQGYMVYVLYLRKRVD